MKLSVEKGELSLPEDFAFDIESNHPFFSDEGTASMPVTIPASPENLKKLSSPEKITSRNRHIRSQMAFLESGLYRKRCTLVSESASRTEGISASLAFMESEMYSEIQNMTLPDIFADESIAFYSRKIQQFYEFRGDVNINYAGYVMFPVATDLYDDDKVSVINNPGTSGTIKWQAGTVNVGGKEIDAPDGYGVALYLRLWRVINKIADALGYERGNNPFKTDVELKEIVLIHNNADTFQVMQEGTDPAFKIWIKDLVPTVTLGEFFGFLQDVFGAYVTVENGKMDVRLMKDDIVAEADADLSGYARSEQTVFYPEPKFITREFDTSIDYAEPAMETILDLRASYDALTEVTKSDDITGKGLFHVNTTGQYFYKEKNSSTPARLGSDCFKYWREVDIKQEEEISSENRFLPMIYVDELSMYMPYIGKRNHKYLEVDGKDTAAEQPIQMCYCFLWQDPYGGSKQHFCASSYSYYEDGRLATYYQSSPHPTFVSYKPLVPEGLTEYWSVYTQLVANGAPELEVTLDIPVEQLLKLNRFTPKIFKGARALIKGMSYSISDCPVFTVKATLQILPHYVDGVYIPATIEFNTPVIEIVLVWEPDNNRERPGYSDFGSPGSYHVIEDDGLEDYTMADAPGYKPTAPGEQAKSRSRWERYEWEYEPDYGGGYQQPSEYGTVTWREWFVAKIVEEE